KPALRPETLEAIADRIARDANQLAAIRPVEHRAHGIHVTVAAGRSKRIASLPWLAQVGTELEEMIFAQITALRDAVLCNEAAEAREIALIEGLALRCCTVFRFPRLDVFRDNGIPARGDLRAAPLHFRLAPHRL